MMHSVSRQKADRVSARATAGLAAACSIAFSGLALAQELPPDSSRSKASALFQHGIEQMQEKRYDAACPALEESYFLSRLYGTLFTLAECHAQAGQVASASVRYGDFLELTGKLPEAEMIRQRARREQAAAQKKALEPLIPRLTLSLAQPLPQGTTPADVIIKQNGRPVLASTLGVPLPTDPGKYRLTTQVEGGPETEQLVEIAPGQSASIALKVAPAAKKPAPKAGPAAAPPPPPQPSRTLAYAVGGAGVVALGVGAAAGLLSLGPAADARSQCRDKDCLPEGYDAATRANTLRNVSLVSLAAGAAAVGVGVYFYLSPPGASRPVALAPVAAPHEGQLLLRGSW